VISPVSGSLAAVADGVRPAKSERVVEVPIEVVVVVAASVEPREVAVIGRHRRTDGGTFDVT